MYVCARMRVPIDCWTWNSCMHLNPCINLSWPRTNTTWIINECESCNHYLLVSNWDSWSGLIRNLGGIPIVAIITLFCYKCLSKYDVSNICSTKPTKQIWLNIYIYIYEHDRVGRVISKELLKLGKHNKQLETKGSSFQTISSRKPLFYENTPKRILPRSQ